MSLKTRSQYQDGNTSSCVELVEKVNNGVTVVLASKQGFGLGRINVINLGYSTIGRSRSKLGAAVAANRSLWKSDTGSSLNENFKQRGYLKMQNQIYKE